MQYRILSLTAADSQSIRFGDSQLLSKIIKGRRLRVSDNEDNMINRGVTIKAPPSMSDNWEAFDFKK